MDLMKETRLKKLGGKVLTSNSIKILFGSGFCDYCRYIYINHTLCTVLWGEQINYY